MNTVLLKDVIPKIGRLLKIVREKTGRNQGGIAEMAGISVSMLSQIERGMVAPSIETLMTVCNALDIDVSELFKKIASDKPVRIQRKGERLKNEQSGVRYEQLMTSSYPGYQAELFLLEVGAEKSTSFRGGGHEGAEMGYVLCGEATLVVDGTPYTIGEGDSFSFNARLPHQLSNASSTSFKAIWSISPPHVDFLESTEQVSDA